MSRIRLADPMSRHVPVAEEVERRVLEVIRSGRWVGGPVVREAERAVAAMFGREAAVGVASGTDALILGLQALGIQRGDRVAVPAVTFFATIGAVCALGAEPVVVDVDERGLMGDLEGAGPLAAAVPVHLFGNLCSAARLGVPVLDDAAQAAASEPPASTGTLTALSTYPTKVWSGLGDGGFVVGDAAAVERVRSLGNHGAVGAHLHDRVAGHVGRNSRLDAIHAAALLGQLPTLRDRIRRRRSIAAHYDSSVSPSLRPIPRDPGNPVPVYVLRTARRDALIAALNAADIDSTVYYPVPAHRQPALAGRIAPTDCPVADRFCDEAVSIPAHAALTDDEIGRVADVLSRFG